MVKRTKLTLADSEENLVVAPMRMQFTKNCIKVRPSVTGYVLVCGQGDCGQLGLGDHISKYERKRPTLLPGFRNVVDISAGGMHNLLLLNDGLVYSFGCNDEGALGRTGCEFEPLIVKLPGKAVKVAAGDSHSACLLEDGRLFAWGTFRGSMGNIGLTINGNVLLPIDISPGMVFCDIASGADHLVMLDRDGKVLTMGVGEVGQLGRVSLRMANRGGRFSRRILLTPGEVIIPHGKPIDAIWATSYCTFMRESKTNKIWAFGLNAFSQLGMSTTSQRVIRPVQTEFENVKEIAGGMHHTLVLKNDGTCSVVGCPDYGRLGLGYLEVIITELVPLQSLASQHVNCIACGDAQSFAVTDDGKLYSWGMGCNSQLGTGSDTDIYEPTCIVIGLTVTFIRAASGGQHSLFLVKDKRELTSIVPANEIYAKCQIKISQFVSYKISTLHFIHINFSNARIPTPFKPPEPMQSRKFSHSAVDRNGDRTPVYSRLCKSITWSLFT